ncbi:hypothetical protein JKI95_06590 [Corynebacterium aquatimens]|uniref:hypothetical protein n=1 Tax=Corynebacterium aquatimens TaxID=1190508 RepID=UPI0025415ED7|nr:hypothetical protein [Corynebacterium aquatimens]QYH18981.1 hypothetical protein JKI95_06590 [Corynebacterium aquatimens]
MNRLAIALALKGANSAFNWYRDQDRKHQGDVYDALLSAVKDGKIQDLGKGASIDDIEEFFDKARAEAGELTRDAHERLDRRRAAFAAAAPDRKARQAALKAQAKAYEKESKNGAGKFIGTALGVAGAAAAAWAVWEYWLSDIVEEKTSGSKSGSASSSGSSKKVTVTKPAPSRTETDAAGKSTLVYSTRSEDGAAGTGAAGTAHTTRLADDPNNEMRPKVAGPLGEEPAERDEALLTSIDDQLSTLDTLEDDQRQATAPRHDDSARSGVLGDTGSGSRSDKVSDADTTIGASGRHELRKDQDGKNRK